jgi:drug/metabolite transporter (DMT)-like permease
MRAATSDYLILALGVCAVSSAALLIREADAPAIVIAAYRLGLASLPLLGLAAVTRQPLFRGTRAGAGLALLAGTFLALHFAFWVASVQQTSVATSVFLVTTAPLFVAIASGPLLGEPPGPATWLGLAIAAAGVCVMIADDLGAGGDTLRGDLYALLGALFAAGYYLAGRRLRTQGIGWLEYITVVYSTSAVILAALLLLSGEAAFGYSARTYVFMALLAALPQLIGHTALNRSLGYLPAVAVSMAVLGEPVGATLLAVLFLGETPTLLELAGAALVLAGVYAGVRPRAAQPAAEMPPTG